MMEGIRGIGMGLPTYKINRRDVLIFGLACVTGAFRLHPALAQSKYPDRPIRLVIPNAFGIELKTI